MPAHPVSRLVRFTLAVGTNVILDHLGYRRPTVHAVRVIEAVELVACHVFNLAEQTCQRFTYGDVERYLAQLAARPGDCDCGRCALAPHLVINGSGCCRWTSHRFRRLRRPCKRARG